MEILLAVRAVASYGVSDFTGDALTRRIHLTDQAERSCVGDGLGAVGRLRLAGYDQHASTTNCLLDTRRLVATTDRTHAASNQGRYP